MGEEDSWRSEKRVDFLGLSQRVIPVSLPPCLRPNPGQVRSKEYQITELAVWVIWMRRSTPLLVRAPERGKTREFSDCLVSPGPWFSEPYLHTCSINIPWKLVRIVNFSTSFKTHWIRSPPGGAKAPKNLRSSVGRASASSSKSLWLCMALRCCLIPMDLRRGQRQLKESCIQSHMIGIKGRCDSKRGTRTAAHRGRNTSQWWLH